MKTGLFLALPLLIAAAPKPAPDDPALVKRLQGYTALPPQTCISRQMLDGPSTYAGAVSYGHGRRIYVNRFGGGCHIEGEDALTVEQFGGQLCRGDRATPFVASTRTVRPTCVFGPFEAYEKSSDHRPGADR